MRIEPGSVPRDGRRERWCRSARGQKRRKFHLCDNMTAVFLERAAGTIFSPLQGAPTPGPGQKAGARPGELAPAFSPPRKRHRARALQQLKLLWAVCALLRFPLDLFPLLTYAVAAASHEECLAYGFRGHRGGPKIGIGHRGVEHENASFFLLFWGV